MDARVEDRCLPQHQTSHPSRRPATKDLRNRRHFKTIPATFPPGVTDADSPITDLKTNRGGFGAPPFTYLKARPPLRDSLHVMRQQMKHPDFPTLKQVTQSIEAKPVGEDARRHQYHRK